MKVGFEYNPLPLYLYTKPSSIHKTGLFSNRPILPHVTGKTHTKNIKGEVERLPLGGWINHSEDPNCELFLLDGELWLKNIKTIQKGDELTVKYGMVDKYINDDIK